MFDRPCPKCGRIIKYGSTKSMEASAQMGKLCTGCTHRERWAPAPGELNVPCSACGKAREFKNRREMKEYIAEHLDPADRLCRQCYFASVRTAAIAARMTASPSEAEKLLVSTWSRRVRRRDNSTCQCCGASGVELHAHHILTVIRHPFLSLVEENGTTLCSKCHQGPGGVHGSSEPSSEAVAALRLRLLE